MAQALNNWNPFRGPSTVSINLNEAQNGISIERGDELIKAENSTEEKNEFLKTVTVEQIHEEFYSEHNRIVEDAQNILENISESEEKVIDLHDRRRGLGFGHDITSTLDRGVYDLQRKKSKIDHINNQKKAEASACNYFSMKYPHYKFITEDSIKKICEKYNLVYSEVSNYIGDVPEKNLIEIEEFSIKEEDVAFGELWNRTYSRVGSKKFHEDADKEQKQQWIDQALDPNDIAHPVWNKIPLHIAAPVKDFDTSGNVQIQDGRLTVTPLDPVVFQPVTHDNGLFYLIMTAWGEEASDELVVNQKMN